MSHTPGTPAPVDRGAGRRRAFTIAEMVVALSITMVLSVGIASAITIASKALPVSNRPVDQIVEAARGAQLLTSELACATSVVSTGATSVKFAVPDRDADGHEETIVYAWSGKAGDPLTRTINGGAPIEVASGVQSFALSYTTRSSSTTTTTTSPTQSAEAELASFTGWPGVSLPTVQNYTVSTTSWLCQSFGIIVPPGSTAVTFTKVTMKMRTTDATGGKFNISIYKSSGTGSSAPTGSALVTAQTPDSSLSGTASWMPVPLTNGRIAGPGQYYSIVASGTVANAMTAQTYSYALAPDNGTMMGTSTNGGSTWTMQGNSRDTLFYVYGTFESMTTTTTTVNHNYLTGATVTLRTGTDPSTEVTTSVQTLNEPEVP